MPHLAPTYAAVLALCTIGTPEAYQVINRYYTCSSTSTRSHVTAHTRSFA